MTGWSNGVASLDRSIALVAFELWNLSNYCIKATPRKFRGSFILNNRKLSTNFYVASRLLPLAKHKWMLAATAMGGLCFHRMMHSALAICLISFFIDPRPVTLHTVFEKMFQRCEVVSDKFCSRGGGVLFCWRGGVLFCSRGGGERWCRTSFVHNRVSRMITYCKMIRAFG